MSNSLVLLVPFINNILQVTGVKAGKIPLVKSKKNTGTWPAGNPTAVKFQHENAQYEHAEDEPYYASKVRLKYYSLQPTSPMGVRHRV